MRRTGFVDTVHGLGGHDHVCWVFDAPGDYLPVVARFLADGLAGGQRVVFVADGAHPDDLDGVDGFAAARAAGAAQVWDLAAYGGAGPVDPDAQVRAYAAMTEQAIADGFAGLRVAANATPLVRTAEARAAFARYEFLIDGYMARRPMSAMCGYHRGELGGAAAAELAGMHPLARPASTALRLFAADPRTTTAAAALAGEIDVAGHEQLRTALARADLTPVGGTITVDARELAFIDHRGLTQLAGHFRDRGATIELLVGRHGSVSLLADVLQLDNLRVVTS
ncbi:MEDS domain-containing protein [Dactylosporangium cerinum]|uniref:MEDS domain-containing protein n=1 Tax=Dactylosporangium cerinum TaxID=1434730 RepID=A0ABV9VT43_9ACTN